MLCVIGVPADQELGASIAENESGSQAEESLSVCFVSSPERVALPTLTWRTPSLRSWVQRALRSVSARSCSRNLGAHVRALLEALDPRDRRLQGAELLLDSTDLFRRRAVFELKED
jgi:hypothetical protein